MRQFATRGSVIAYAPEGGTGTGGAAGGTGGGDVLATIPEAFRGHAAFNGVTDLGGVAKGALAIATEYHGKLAAGSKPFAEQLPEKIRGDAAFKDIKDLDALANSYLNQGKMLGVPKDKLLRLPDDPAAEGAMDDVFTRLGRPAKPDDYKIDPPKGQTFNDTDKAFQSVIRAAAHKAGLNQAQLDGLRGALDGFGAEVAKQQSAAVDARVKETTALLEKEWGPASGDAFKQKYENAEGAIGYLAEKAGTNYDALSKELKAAGLQNSPTLIKALEFVGRGLREDGTLAGRNAGGGASSAALSPAEAQQKINALMADKTFTAKYGDKMNPGHADAVEEMRKLYDQAHPAAAQKG